MRCWYCSSLFVYRLLHWFGSQLVIFHDCYQWWQMISRTRLLLRFQVIFIGQINCASITFGHETLAHLNRAIRSRSTLYNSSRSLKRKNMFSLRKLLFVLCRRKAYNVTVSTYSSQNSRGWCDFVYRCRSHRLIHEVDATIRAYLFHDHRRSILYNIGRSVRQYSFRLVE